MLEQRTKEWFNARRTGITATDISAITGANPWKKPIDVYYDKKKQEQPPDENSEAMKWGRENEGNALEVIRILWSNGAIEPTGLHVKDKLLLASPDAIHTVDGKRVRLFEIKCPYNLELPNSIPEYYLMQCQWQMMVTEIKECILFYWTPNGNRWFVIEYDEAYCTALVKEAMEFWNEYVLKDIEPPTEEVTEITAETDGIEIILETADRYRQVTDTIKELEAEKKKLKQELVDFANERKMKGLGISITPYWHTGTDYKAPCLRSGLSPDVKEPYRVWRITVKKKEE